MLTQLNERVQQVLQGLNPESSRRWGIMDPQHMVEHLASVLDFSTGKFGVPFSGDPEEAAKHKTHFFSTEYPFPRKLALPNVDPPSPPELKAENMEGAKQMLEAAHQGFLEHYQQQPEDKNPHPFFDILNYPEWVEFHVKHLEHHMMQFSVIPEPKEVA